jgi:prevent-host-death family protein
MRSVNALDVRNKLGAILDELEKTGEPVVVSKGRRPRAVLITVGDYQKRFIDRQTEERRQELLAKVRAARASTVGGADSLTVLRELRGEPR